MPEIAREPVEVKGLLSGIENLMWRNGEHGKPCDGAVSLPTIEGIRKIHLWYLEGSFSLDIFINGQDEPITINLGKIKI